MLIINTINTIITQDVFITLSTATADCRYFCHDKFLTKKYFIVL